MNKRNYVAPLIKIVEMDGVEMIATSLIESNGTPKVIFGGGSGSSETESGNAGEEALSAGRQYFDDWNEE